MNSSELQKKHSKVYENFFASNLIVVSSPFLINRSGDVHPDFSGVSIKQKIPLRLYVGIQKNTYGENFIGNVYSYDYVSDAFEIQEGENYASFGGALLLEIGKLLPEDRQSITINILSEIPRTLGLGYNSILSLCLSSLLHIIEDPSICEGLIDLPKENIQKSLDANKIIQQILRTSMKLDVVINGKMGISLKISSFFESYYPIVSFKDRSPHIIQGKDLNKTGFYGLRMNELWHDVQEVSFPFDFGVIVSDKPVLRENLKNINYIPPINNYDRMIMRGAFDGVLPAHKRIEDKLPKFYRFLDESHDDIYAVYGDMMGAISMEVLATFGKVLASSYSDEILTHFFLTINKIRYGNNIVRESSHYFLSFIDALLASINLSSCEFAVFPNDTLIMGGTLTYVSYSAKNINAILSGVEKVRHSRPSIQMLYSNAIDGIAHRGLVLEQHIDKGIVSKHVNYSSRILEDALGKKLVAEFAYLIQHPDYDLVLDVFNQKIYYKGKRLTSQHLSSQSATIELLKLLLLSGKNEISNKEMSYSSYSKNKNELNSKIIVPLEKWVKQETGKDCIIKATGSLTEFAVYIKLNTLKIAFVDRKKPKE